MLNPSGDTPLNRLYGMDSAEASVVFATQYDGAIQSLRGALMMMDGLSDEDNMAMLDRVKEMVERTTTIHGGMSVQESIPFVEVSDLMYLGLLANRLWEGRDGFMAKMMDDLL